MAYKSSSAPHSTPVGTTIRGCGVLMPGIYTGELVVNDRQIRFTSLPEGMHIEFLPSPPEGLADSKRAVATIGLSEGAALRRNAKGEYAFVDANNKDNILTAWHPALHDALQEGSKIPITLAIPYLISISTPEGVEVWRHPKAPASEPT